MANEITVTASLAYSKGGASATRSTTAAQFTMSGTHAIENIQEIEFASYEALGTGEISTLGWCWAKNLDSTNYVDLGFVLTSVFYPFVRLAAGESAVFRLATSYMPYAKANTAKCLLWYMIVEN